MPAASGGAGSAMWRSRSSARCTRTCRPDGIGAAGMEVILPTGKEPLGLGNGYTVFEPFAMWGQMLPRNSFLQLHGGVELPADSAKASSELYRPDRGRHHDRAGPRLRTGLVAAGRDAVGPSAGRPSEWDVVPQVQVTLSKLQHVMIAGGRTDSGDASGRIVRRRAWSTCSGTGSTAASSSSGNEPSHLVDRRRRGGVAGGMPVHRRCGPTRPRRPARRRRRASTRARGRGDVRALDRVRGVPQQPGRPRAARTSRSARAGAASIMANAARDPYVLRERPARDDRSCAAAPPTSKTSARRVTRRRRRRSRTPPAGRRGSSRIVAAVAAGSEARWTSWRWTACRARSATRSRPTGLGTRESFNGNFVVAPPRPDGRRRAFGPFEVDAGRRRLMQSVTRFEQEQAPHIRESELCATCHTLITEALGPMAA